MGELLPLLLGVGVGLLVGTRATRAMLAAVCGVALVAGPTASWLNGEIGELWPILFDTAQVLAAVAMTVAVRRRTDARGGRAAS
jgi:hypothetical protein